MGTYAVTGSASGMGKAVVDRLVSEGNVVVGIDLRDADVIADLSAPSGRSAAAAAVIELCGGVLDGAVMAAGLGPAPGRDRPRMIAEVNVLGVIELLEAWQPSLARAERAKVVVFASNATTTVPMVPKRVVRALLEGDVDRAVQRLRLLGKAAPTFAYAASKVAVSHWVRRQAVTPDWAGAGIRLNALAPGAIMTPLLEQQLATPAEARRIKAFPVPIGGFGDANQLAAWVVFMLSDAADFLCGSVVFVDGGSDAWFRATDWPRPVPARHLRRYVARMRSFRQRARSGA
ncbi:SDR family oxidoreductase [Nocardioides sp. CPCC 206347]|uniref:SDR family oxidoreductase n=2 Tax=Nocardioides TaxID=1839 RepID=UPI003B428B48